MSQVFIVECTDRHRHRPAKLTRFVIADDGSAEVRVGMGYAPPGYERPDGKTNEVHVFACWRCPRSVELREEKLRVLVPILLKRGVSRLDISRLPF